MVQVRTEDRFAHGRVIIREDDMGVPEVIDRRADRQEVTGVLEAEREVPTVLAFDLFDVAFRVDALFDHIALDRGEIPRIEHFLPRELVTAHDVCSPGDGPFNERLLHFSSLSETKKAGSG